MFVRAVLLVSIGLLLAGCGAQEIRRKEGGSSLRPFTLSNIAKGDVDTVCEMTQRDVLRGLRVLAEKLYRRNPREYRKAGYETPEAAVAALFEPLPRWGVSAQARGDWQADLRTAFEPDYAGDRVGLLMSALTTMLMASYNHRTEFFLTDELSAQKLYNSARNVEVAIWRLSNARYADGTLLLISNGLEDGERNLSFEREFGKIIGLQDLLARVIEDKTNRTITRALQNVATFIFFPI